MNDSNWITTEQAAQLLGKTDRQVRRYCRDEMLVSERDGKRLLIEYASVQEFLNNGQVLTDDEEDEMDDIVEQTQDTRTEASSHEVPQQGIYELAEQFRASVASVNNVADMLCQKLLTEHRKNQDIQTTIAKLVGEMQVPVMGGRASVAVSDSEDLPVAEKNHSRKWLTIFGIVVLWVVLMGLVFVVASSLPFKVQLISG